MRKGHDGHLLCKSPAYRLPLMNCIARWTTSMHTLLPASFRLSINWWFKRGLDGKIRRLSSCRPLPNFIGLRSPPIDSNMLARCSPLQTVRTLATKAATGQWLASVPMGPADPILGLTERFNQVPTRRLKLPPPLISYRAKNSTSSGNSSSSSSSSSSRTCSSHMTIIVFTTVTILL